MIEIRHVTKKYGEKYAVKDISFQVKPGEIVGFLGRNGAGKTTTMNIITGYISSTHGSVTVDGYDILKDPIEVKRRIGYLPELPPVYMDMTVNEYLHFSADLKKLPKTARKGHLDEICELVRIADMRDRMIKNLSKGYKQRVGLAQALVGNPPVLIFDEPTVGLDPKQIIEIRNLIRTLGKKHTLILSSHILPEVSFVCERVVIIHKGEILAQDKLSNLMKGVGESSMMIARVAGPERQIISTLRTVAGVKKVTPIGSQEPDTMDFHIEAPRGSDVRQGIFYALARAGYPMLMLKPMDTTLEDIFLQLTEKREGYSL